MPVRYPKHAATLAWARKQIGQHEQPPASNTGAFVIACQRATWLAGTRWEWCRAFSLKAHQEGGFKLPDGSAGAWDALDRARKRGDALTPRQHLLAIPGDEVIWAFGAGHCSILTGFSVRAGVVYVHSIDGNVENQVEPCERPLSLVKGFIHWPEPRDPGAHPPKRPRIQVVGGLSGHRQLVTRNGHVIPLPKKRGAKPTGIVPKPTPVKKKTTAKKTPARRYYTRRDEVKLKRGERVAFQPGKGYYARKKPKAA